MGRCYERLSLWEPCEPRKAVCCADGQAAVIERPEPWMLGLVPHGEHVIFVGGKPFVLSRTDACSGGVNEGSRYFHYMIGDQIYSGIFVG